MIYSWTSVGDKTMAHEDNAKSIDLLNIIDPDKRERIILLVPEAGPRGADELVARTRCEIVFDNENDLQSCVDALRESDEELKRRPDSLKLWSWEITYREGMTIHFGVNWYDRAFFEQRKEAFRTDRHAAIFKKFNATPDRFKVVHEVIKEE
jgi:hypothetical protein